MIPDELRALHITHFNVYAKDYDLTENEGCGKYTEHWVKFAQDHGWSKVGHLKKTGSATQYNGHANDAFLYNEPEGPNDLLQAVDIIANAEAKPPYTPTNRPPAAGWGVDEPRYKESDWLKEPQSSQNNPPHNTIEWKPYWGDAKSDLITRTLFFDFSRRPESANFGMGRWLNRCLHSAFFGPEGIPLGEQGALDRHRPEWCVDLDNLDPTVEVPPSFLGVCEGVWK